MGKQQEKARAMSPAPTATIKVKYHDGASKLGSDIHGVMCDLAASETVVLKKGEKKIIPLGVSMKLPDGYFGLVVPRSSTCINCGIAMGNSVGIIENDYCGPNDVWGFVAIALEDTTIEAGTRIAQFMPVAMHDWATTRFEEPEEWPYPNRGGYGSTGEKSAEVRTAEVRTHRDANGLELHVGDYVIDEFGECYCVMGLHEGYGATAAYADLGNSRTPLEVAPCLSLRLDERPRDCDGVPIEVGDTIWVVSEDGSSVYDCSVVVVNTDGANGLVRVREKSENGWSDFLFPSKLTHREPDSFEKIAADAVMSWEDYCENHRLDVNDDIETEEHAMQADILRRIEAVAARG